MNRLDSIFFFFLIKKRNKKIKVANKKAENFNLILKSRNSPTAVHGSKLVYGSNRLDFLTDNVKIFSTFYSRPLSTFDCIGFN